MKTDDPWTRVRKRWKDAAITASAGASTADISAFERGHQVTLPEDVRRYFTTLNGTGNDMDNDTYRFWPLAEVKPVYEVLAPSRGFEYPDRYAYPDCFAFADYMISSWLYAVKLTGDPAQPAPVYRVTASDVPGEQMTESFLDFMNRYADDPNSVY
jgi:hypothetical protein